MSTCRGVIAAFLLAVVVAAGVSGVALADAKYGKVNQAKPYNAIVSGLFHEQKIASGGVTGQYTIYIPADLQPWRPAVIVLIPQNQTAKAFAEGATGKRWMAAGDKANFAVAFLEASDAKDWNTAGKGRDECEFVRRVYMNMRNKSVKVDAAFTMDKFAVALIGYGGGGAAAQLVAAELPAAFNSLTTIDAGEVSADLLKKAGAKITWPWPNDAWTGREDVLLPANEVPMRVWMIRASAGAPENTAAIDYWKGINAAAPAGDNVRATVFQGANPHVAMWITGPDKAGTITEEVIWNEFQKKIKRVLAYAGGRLEEAIDYVPNKDGRTGFFVSEETVDGRLRRWLTYIPPSYNSDYEMPLVVSLHGSSESMYCNAEETHWFDVAAEYGFIVVFGHAYVNERPTAGTIPAAYWNDRSIAVGEDGSDDVLYVKHIIEATKKKYMIDTSRVYMTGHSNGSNMTWVMGLEAPELFAAIAPIGGAWTAALPGFASHLILPVWTHKGEYDVDGAAYLAPGTNNHKAIKHWNRKNGADETLMEVSSDETGRYTHYTFPNSDGVPLVRFSTINNTPHVAFPDQSAMLWTEFFSKFYRNVDGTLVYEGELVQRRPYVEYNRILRGR